MLLLSGTVTEKVKTPPPKEPDSPEVPELLMPPPCQCHVTSSASNDT
jgi:hypothetical protein